METLTPPRIVPTPERARRSVAAKLFFIGLLLAGLQIGLVFINELRQERMKWRDAKAVAAETSAVERGASAAEGYRMTERALKHGALIIALVFTAFFLFERLAGLRLHVMHYALVGAALCLFYLALLALGEVLPPGAAYAGAAVASSALIVGYCVTILRSASRAGVMAGLLATEHGTLFVVLRLEDYALLAGTAVLFVALGAVMFLTRHVDWAAEDAPAA